MKWNFYVKIFFKIWSILFVFKIILKNYLYCFVIGKEGEIWDIFILCIIYFLVIIYWKKNILIIVILG